MQKIVLPSSLRKISWKAFEYCTGLREIEIPEGTEKVEEFAFSHCEVLKNIRILGTNTVIEKDAFIACENFNIIAPNTDISEFPEFYRMMSVFGYAYATEHLQVVYSPASELSHLKFLEENKETFLFFAVKRNALYLCIKKHFTKWIAV